MRRTFLNPGWRNDGVLEDYLVPFYPWEGVPPVICLYKVWSMHLVSWLPCVVHFGISFPLDQVLELSGLSMMLVAVDLLHFILLFTFD